MSEGEALVAAIAAGPRDDDAPLLVYADWLDEHGDAKLAAKIRLATARLTDAQWDLVAKALGELITNENGGTRIAIGGYSYSLFDVSVATARQGLIQRVRDGIKEIRREVRWRVIRGLRGKCIVKWNRVFQRVFKSHYLYEPLAEVIRRKVRERTTMKAIGVATASDLSCRVDDMLVNSLCGCDDWMSHDPATVPDLDARLKTAILGFDPWTFDWSRVKLPPKVRERMAAAGFRFSA